MIRASAVTLLGEIPEAHGVYETPERPARLVACTVQSVHASEFYAALNQQLRPECVLVLGNYAEYQDEKECIFEGKRYKIIRPYVRSDNRIELTVERVTNHDV
ncbi:MAG: hypothetical protein IIY19_01795 [Lachnospiraceae bacterium]|nr:hypothetical protein [Lachnospiraceae bacterium]